VVKLPRTAAALVAVLLQRAVLGATAWACGYDPLSPSTWARWDSSYYLDIAAAGYQPLRHCWPETHYPAAAWCGNAGWFPGFPWALSALHHAGVPLPLAAVLVPLAAQLGCIWLLWDWLGGSLAALLFAAFFPGNVYLAAAFPVSLFLFGALLLLRGCANERPLLAAAGGALAAVTYPTGVLLAPVALAWGAWRRKRAAVWAAAGVLGGFVCVLAALQMQAGAWDAYFRIQAHYGYKAGFFADALFARLKPLVNPRYRDAKGFVTGLQTLLCAALVVLVALRALRAGTRERLVALYVAAFWLAPLTLGGPLSLYRAEALLLPGAALLPDAPRPVQAGFAAAAVGLSIPMGVLFFRGILV
jgi:hypothetical protein